MLSMSIPRSWKACVRARRGIAHLNFIIIIIKIIVTIMGLTSFGSFICRIDPPPSKSKTYGFLFLSHPSAHNDVLRRLCVCAFVPLCVFACVCAFVQMCIPQKVQTGKYQKMKRRFKTEQSDAFSAGTLHFGDICLSVHLFILFLQEMLNFVASNSWGQIILNIAEPPKN